MGSGVGIFCAQDLWLQVLLFFLLHWLQLWLRHPCSSEGKGISNLGGPLSHGCSPSRSRWPIPNLDCTFSLPHDDDRHPGCRRLPSYHPKWHYCRCWNLEGAIG